MYLGTVPCFWLTCPSLATSQVTIPAPEDRKAITWFCAGHERLWNRALAANVALVSYDFGRPPLVGWIPTR